MDTQCDPYFAKRPPLTGARAPTCLNDCRTHVDMIGALTVTYVFLRVSIWQGISGIEAHNGANRISRHSF